MTEEVLVYEVYFLDKNQKMISDKIYSISISYYDGRDKYAKKPKRVSTMNL